MRGLVQVERIESRIFLIREQKVMLDKDLAELYGVETKALNQAVKRNNERFPEDFAFLLTKEEIFNISQIVLSPGQESEKSRSQIVTLKRGQNIKYPPRAFTEHGVAMLSSVLKSRRAIQVNIQIMRTFTKLRQILATHKELALKLSELEGKVQRHDSEIIAIFEAIRKLMMPPEIKKKRIGF